MECEATLGGESTRLSRSVDTSVHAAAVRPAGAPNRPGGVPSRLGSTFGMVGTNGSAAFADIDAGIAVAVMRNRFAEDLTTVARLDRIIAETLS